MPERTESTTPLTVTELTARIKQRLEQAFAHTEVTGEVSRLTRPASGHLYFTIKDRHAAISAVVWRSTAARLKTQPEEGGEYIFSGHVGVYEPRGTYQLIVTRIEESGAGRLAAEFEQRKLLFAERGWFEPARKQAIPKLPQHIGIVTSPTAAAFEDVKKVLATRPGWLTLTLSPCLVQGAEAPATIAAAIKRLAAMEKAPEIILVVRGGGSIEDLWGFNDEAMVKAIVECPVPVITGIGHEIDVTLADFAADARAATPSNAAEMAAPSREELRRHLPRLPLLQGLMRERMQHEQRKVTTQVQALQHRWQRLQDNRHLHLERSGQHLGEGLRRQLQRQHQGWQALQRRLTQQEPGYQLRQRHQQVGRLIRRLEDSSHRLTSGRHQRTTAVNQRLHAALPRQLSGRLRIMQPLTQRLHSTGERLIPVQRQSQASTQSRLLNASMQQLERHRSQWQQLRARLQGLSPEQVLERGYTLARDAQGNIITSVRGLRAGQRLDIRFHDGHADTEIKRIETGEQS
jgi:exodeoxyribonuclease VII large subunit